MREVLPRHVFIRWHIRFFARYNRLGHEIETEEFKRLRNDRRLLIDREDYHFLMEKAHRNQRKHNLPEDFFADIALLCQASPDGLVPLDKEDEAEMPHTSINDNASIMTVICIRAGNSANRSASLKELTTSTIRS
jgi:hypothetical protein